MSMLSMFVVNSSNPLLGKNLICRYSLNSKAAVIYHLFWISTRRGMQIHISVLFSMLILDPWGQDLSIFHSLFMALMFSEALIQAARHFSRMSCFTTVLTAFPW